jgi:hypothetical protein
MKLNKTYPVCRAFALYVEKHSDKSKQFKYQYKDYEMSAIVSGFDAGMGIVCDYMNFTLKKNGKIIYKNMDSHEFGYIIEVDNKLEHLKSA